MTKTLPPCVNRKNGKKTNELPSPQQLEPIVVCIKIYQRDKTAIEPKDLADLAPTGRNRIWRGERLCEVVVMSRRPMAPMEIRMEPPQQL